jgi:dihydrofolate reductase
LKAIVAVDSCWAIGNKGELLVSLPEDQKGVFRRYTYGNTVIYGRKTLDTFPGRKLLGGRRNIILSRNMDLEADGALILHSIDELREYTRRHAEEQMYVIGGAQIYFSLLHYCDEVIVTKIDAVFEADAFFPDLDSNPDWKLIDITDWAVSVKGYRYCVARYRRVL